MSAEEVWRKPLLARNFGTSYAIDAFGEVMARDGAWLVVSSRTDYMPHALTAEDEYALAMTPTANEAPYCGGPRGLCL